MLKENARTLKIKEQMIPDLVTGLTLMFGVTDLGEARLRIQGDNLPLGNRDFQFNVDGELVGTGTATGPCASN